MSQVELNVLRAYTANADISELPETVYPGNENVNMGDLKDFIDAEVKRKLDLKLRISEFEAEENARRINRALII